MERKYFVCGNWKMNKNQRQTEEFFKEFASTNFDPEKVEVGFGVGFTNLYKASECKGNSNTQIFAQNVHAKPSGAFTGETSLEMLLDTGCSGAIIGHSERRQYYNETDAEVAEKAKALTDAGSVAIACVGETKEERENEQTLEVVGKQVKAVLEAVTKMEKLVIAYEPVWAIGTGLTASPEQAQEVHAFIRNLVKTEKGGDVASKIQIIYGGSMKPANAKELLAQSDIDGGLIGGASLDPKAFSEIIAAT